MRVENKVVAAVYRGLLVAVCLTGLILNFTTWGPGAAGLLSYYTIQSNIVVLVFFAYLLCRWRRPEAAASPTLKGAVTVCITLTFLVYHFVLRPMLFSMGAETYVPSPANALVHYAVPLMVIADWLLFDDKGEMKKLDPVKWLAIPLAYLLFALARAPFGLYPGTSRRYPYFFIDIDEYGGAQVALNCVVFGVGYALLGYLVFGVDRLIPAVAARWRR
ncbi:MAG: Pr6Pr family membrane protein [Propionibacteriaceae bacterium]|jgi:hypothetical protein|nr:Pr6Pr family membrane protein [Propionibacteriaceae bacterium]